MEISDCWLRRQIIGCLVVLLAVPVVGQAATPQPLQNSTGHQASDENSAGSHSAQRNLTSILPEDPGPQTPDTGNPQSSSSAPAVQSSQSSTSDQSGNSNALGTAAAPYEKNTGVAASRPAGAVIAPAKQRRAFSFLIKVGVIVGAAVAIGTVVALSKASPNRPNN